MQPENTREALTSNTLREVSILAAFQTSGHRALFWKMISRTNVNATSPSNESYGGTGAFFRRCGSSTMRPCIRNHFFICPICTSTADCAFADDIEESKVILFISSTAALGRSAVGRDATSSVLPDDRSRRANFSGALGSVGRQRLVARIRSAGRICALACRPRRFLPIWPARRRVKRTARRYGGITRSRD